MAVAITRTADPAGVSSSSSIATYSSVSIGTADTNRVVALVVTSELTSASPNSATIDYGSGAVAMSASTQGNFGAVYARIFYARVPTGTTATFAVTFGANANDTQNHVSVYAITGGVVSATGGNGSTDMDATAPLTTGSITIATNGGFLAVAAGATDTVAKTWANATEDLDIDAGGFRHTTASSTTAGTVTVTCTGGTNNEDGAMSWLILIQGDNLDATGIATGAPVVGTPALTIPVDNLTATGITVSPVVGTPAITQVHALLPAHPSPDYALVWDVNNWDLTAWDGYAGIYTGAPAVGNPSFVYSLTATGIGTGAPTVGTPAITQAHSLTATGITATPTVGTPAITQAHVLAAAGIGTGAPTVGTPTITQLHVLAATGIGTGAPTVGTPELTENASGTLIANGITATPDVGTPTLTQVHVLVATGITATPVVGVPALTSGSIVIEPAQTGGGPGFALSFRQERDWQKIRRAREEVRTALEEAISGPRKKRQAAAQKAAAAIGNVAEFIRQPGDEAWDDVLADLERLMATLDGAVRQAEARAAAEEWARIEAEFRAQQQFLEEELLVVLALAI